MGISTRNAKTLREVVYATINWSKITSEVVDCFMRCHGLKAIPFIDITLWLIKKGTLSAAPNYRVRRLLKKSMRKASIRRKRKMMEDVKQVIDDIVIDLKFSDIVGDLDY